MSILAKIYLELAETLAGTVTTPRELRLEAKVTELEGKIAAFEDAIQGLSFELGPRVTWNGYTFELVRHNDTSATWYEAKSKHEYQVDNGGVVMPVNCCPPPTELSAARYLLEAMIKSAWPDPVWIQAIGGFVFDMDHVSETRSLWIGRETGHKFGIFKAGGFHSLSKGADKMERNAFRVVQSDMRKLAWPTKG